MSTTAEITPRANREVLRLTPPDGTVLAGEISEVSTWPHQPAIRDVFFMDVAKPSRVKKPFLPSRNRPPNGFSPQRFASLQTHS